MRVQVGPPSASISLWVVEPEEVESRKPSGKIEIQKPTRPSRSNADEPSPPESTERVKEATPRLSTILVLHGIWDGKESMLSMGKLLSRHGFRVVLVDLRGHGRSSGDFLTYGRVDAGDLSQVIDKLSAEGLVSKELGVVAPSYGGAAAIQLAAIDSRVQAGLRQRRFQLG